MARKGLSGTTVVIIILALIGLIYAQSKGYVNFNFPFSTTGPSDQNLVNVNKQLKWTLIDKYAGSALASLTNVLSIYDTDGSTLLESNLDTDASGQGNSAFSYPSGKMVYFKLDSTNNHQWFQVTVPKMNMQDAESATYNLIELRSFSIGTYTDTFKCQNGTTIADAGSYDASSSGTTMTFTYSMADTGSDNTGLMTSFDPLYDCNYNIVLYVVVSGTGYERILFYGFEKDYTLGTTHYLASNLDAYKLTKYKVGNTYLSTGALDFTFSTDMTGVTAGDSITVQIYMKAYSDYNYAAAHGQNYGPLVVETAETTMTVTP